MTPRVVIMAAGAFKRFSMNDASGAKMPKPLAPFNGVPNIVRTMRLAREINPYSELYVSFPQDKVDLYNSVVFPSAPDYHVVVGQNSVEGWKFRNILSALVPFVTVLYGDVYYYKDDLSLIMSYQMDGLDAAFFCHVGPNMKRLCPSEKGRPVDKVTYIGKNGSEATGWRIGENLQAFLDAVEKDAKGAGDRGTSYSLYNNLDPERRRMISTSEFTTDFDSARDYQQMVKYWEENGAAS